MTRTLTEIQSSIAYVTDVITNLDRICKDARKEIGKTELQVRRARARLFESDRQLDTSRHRMRALLAERDVAQKKGDEDNGE